MRMGCEPKMVFGDIVSWYTNFSTKFWIKYHHISCIYINYMANDLNAVS